jgi:hypothetical protein
VTVFTIADLLVDACPFVAAGFVVAGGRRLYRVLADRKPGTPVVPPPGERVDGPVVLPWPQPAPKGGAR